MTKGLSNERGTLYVVATPIGNLDDLSGRAAAVLADADLVAAEDTRRTRRLLHHLGVERPLLALHEHNEAARTDSVLRHLRAGESVALVSDAGTPLISDPGFPLVRACHAEGIRVVPVPGPSALVAALSVAGLPTDRFRFEGFLPRRESARAALLEELATAPETLVFYESSHRIVATLTALVGTFGGERPITLARELTKLHETLLSGTLAEVLTRVQEDENQRKGEFVLVVGGAPARRSERLELGLDELLDVLLAELPLKRAVAVVARLSGEKRNHIYRRALERRGEA